MSLIASINSHLLNHFNIPRLNVTYRINKQSLIKSFNIYSFYQKPINRISIL